MRLRREVELTKHITFYSEHRQPSLPPPAPDLKLLKQGIWLYFLLLLFEGALRKWGPPALSTPLLVVRDPIALFLIIRAWWQGLIRLNGYLSVVMAVSVIATVTALLFGHQNLFVALYGVRILVLHFPLMFVIARAFSYQDVIRIGKMMVYLAFPMLVLIVLQFYSPQSAWVNRGLAGDTAGVGFQGALGFFRPPGTFSFTNGNTLFWSFLAAYLFYFSIVQPRRIARFWTILAAFCLILSIPYSISRTLFFQVIITMLFTLFAAIHRKKQLNNLIVVVVATSIVLFFLASNESIQLGLKVFTARFESASEFEGGLHGTLVDRFLGGMFGVLTESGDLPFWGFGIGMGTNVGGMLLSGSRSFLISEGEWGRLVGEMGVLLGLTVIFVRVALVVSLFMRSFRRLRVGDPLPWLLLSFGFLLIIQAQWAQPTALGFSTLIGGLILASLKGNKKIYQ